MMDPGERAARFRFRDRAGQFTDAFGPVLSGAGTEVAKVSPRSPRANAYGVIMQLSPLISCPLRHLGAAW
jgi:hypothetical protein